MSSINKSRYRLAIGSFFFLHGLCFATWGSRIPTIQQSLNLSEAQLGSVLFAIPVGSLFAMVFASSLIERFSSKKILIIAIFFYNLALVSLGIASTTLQLVSCLVVFGFISNLVNISINTQAIGLENIYGKSIMASLHGLWSVAGFIAALIGSVMLAGKVTIDIHFIFIFLISLSIIFFNYHYLLPDNTSKDTEKKKTPFVFPDRYLLTLGAITFCSMISEGAMFDWSGVYFKKVIEVKPELVGIGYTAFMTTMSATRFLSDKFLTKFGLKFILLISGILITLGLLISVVNPNMITGIIGFLLVGIGTSSVVPLVISESGKDIKRSTSSSVAVVSAIGFLGFLIGPPMIGWVAGVTNLRVSFSIIALMGIIICILSRKIKDSSLSNTKLEV